MKKILIVASVVTLVGLVFATSRVLASPPAMADMKKSADHTPGPRATQDKNNQNEDKDDRHNSKNNNDMHGKRLNFRGIIDTVDASNLSITLEDGSSAAFLLTTNTIIKIPKLGHGATAADLIPGMQVNVNATRDNAGVMTARMVHVIPGKPMLIHRVGIVTDYQPGHSISILAKDGKTYTFLVTPKTKILPPGRAGLLVVGARVTIISPRDVSGGTMVALRIVIHPTDSDETPSPSPTSTDTPTETPTP